jgi:hypothetical protein
MDRREKSRLTHPSNGIAAPIAYIGDAGTASLKRMDLNPDLANDLKFAVKHYKLAVETLAEIRRTDGMHECGRAILSSANRISLALPNAGAGSSRALARVASEMQDIGNMLATGIIDSARLAMLGQRINHAVSAIEEALRGYDGKAQPIRTDPDPAC